MHVPLRPLLPCLVAAVALLALSPRAAQAQEEVPFITTPDNVTLEMLRLANVGPGDHVIDLGSGDGRIVILAAKRFNATGLGVEIVPDLVRKSISNAQAAGVADRVSFREQDLFKTDLSAATVVTMYLLPDSQLAVAPCPSLAQTRHAHRFARLGHGRLETRPDHRRACARQESGTGEIQQGAPVDRAGQGFEGLWCGAGLLRGTRLQLTQRFQEFEGTLAHRQRSRTLEGRIAGATLRTQGGRAGELQLRADGDELHIAAAAGPLALAQGQTFRRAPAHGCD